MVNVKHDKLLNHIREWDVSQITSLDNESQLDSITWAYDWELIFVKPNSLYSWNDILVEWILVRNRVFDSVNDMNLVQWKDWELATVDWYWVYFWNWTTWNQLTSVNNISRNWSILATQRTAEPVSYDVQPTYEVLEYTYWTIKLYRTVYNTYTPATDVFYTDDTLTTAVASRALSLT
jgi:hypothetical protein